MGHGFEGIWVAVKELKLSYYIGETLLFTIYIYTHYGNCVFFSGCGSLAGPRVWGSRFWTPCDE